MPSNKMILNELDSQLLADVRKLASCNFGPSDIALKLGVNKSSFLNIWRDKKSSIREEYEGGRLDIQYIKLKALKKEVKSRNITAIQIHDKMVLETEFETKKKEIFGLE